MHVKWVISFCKVVSYLFTTASITISSTLDHTFFIILLIHSARSKSGKKTHGGTSLALAKIFVRSVAEFSLGTDLNHCKIKCKIGLGKSKKV